MKALQIILLIIAVLSGVLADRWSFPVSSVREVYFARNKLHDTLSNQTASADMKLIVAEVVMAEKGLEAGRIFARRLLWLSVSACAGALACSLVLRKRPNQAPLPTPMSVTDRAGARSAPDTGAAEL